MTANLAIDVVQDLRSSIRLPLQTSRPDWAQYRQIACWTNRGNGCGKPGLNCRASIRYATASMMSAQPPGLVAGRAIRMVGIEPCQDAGTNQKVVHQGVDGDHAGADLVPDAQAFRGGQQDARQGHGQDLVRHAVDLPERANQSFPQSGEPIGAGSIVGALELPVDPADQVAIGNIANERDTENRPSG